MNSTPSPGQEQLLADLTRAAGSYDRRRAGRACTVCRARKTKCDNRRPVCGFCTATGGHCQYVEDEDTDLSKLDRGSLAILQRLAEMERTLVAAMGAPPTAVAAPIQSMSLQSALENRNTKQGGQPPTAQMIMESAEMSFENICRWPVFGLKSGPPLVSVLAHEGVARQCDPECQINDLDPDTVFQLVENFLQTNHIKNPIFDIDMLWSKVRSVVQSGLQSDADAACLVLLICSVSVLSVSPTKEQQPGFSRQPERLLRAEAFFRASQRRIGMLYHENSLMAIQCSFLTAVYLMTTFRILAAWKVFSQAGTQCVAWLTAQGQLPGWSQSSNWETDALPRFPESQTSMGESLYWSCLKSELELCIELGLSGSSLNEMPYPHVYPSPPSLSILTDLSATTRQGKEDLERGWFFYLAEIALRRIMNDAISSRYGKDSWYRTQDKWWATTTAEGLNGYSSCEYVTEYQSKLEDWYKVLPAPVSFTRDSTEPVHDILSGILRSHYIDILDVIYFPAIRAVVCEPLSELGPDLLRITWEGLRNAIDRITISKVGFWHRHQGTWLMIRTCSRSALYLLGVALRVKYEDGRASALADLLVDEDQWRTAVLQVIHLIEYWEEESIDMRDLLARLKHLYDLAMRT
ncbi:hypothetical protein BJX64DRAFT_250226 [Aspergillus heterothallicus]